VQVWTEGSRRSLVDVRLVTRSATLHDKDWEHPALTPPKPVEFEVRQRQPPTRAVLAGERVTVPGGRAVALDGAHPLAIIERVACQQLVALELDPNAPPLEELLEGPLDLQG
jgi:hypothetical protein